MNNEVIRALHASLGFAFTAYAAHHPDWPVLDLLPRGTMLLFQTDDPDFNAFAWRRAIQGRQTDEEARNPITVIYVRVPDPPGVEEVVWDEAKVLASMHIKACPEPAAVGA